MRIYGIDLAESENYAFGPSDEAAEGGDEGDDERRPRPHGPQMDEQTGALESTQPPFDSRDLH